MTTDRKELIVSITDIGSGTDSEIVPGYFQNLHQNHNQELG